MTLQFSKPARRWATVAAGTALLALALPQAAQAGAKAYALTSYTNFLLKDLTEDPTGGSVLELGVDILTTSFGTDAATLVISNPGGVDLDFATDPNPADGVLVDARMACIGPSCGVAATAMENVFSQGDFNLDEYNRADSLIKGSGLDISAIVAAPQGTIIDTGTADVVSEAITQTTTSDSSTSRYTNTTGLTIVPLAGMSIGLDFIATTDLFAALHADAEVPPSVARASTSFSISLTDNDTGLQVALIDVNGNSNGLTASVSNANPGGVPSVGGVNGIAISYATAAPLIADGRTYTFDLAFTALTDLTAVKVVPEPGALALVGLGLLGFSLRSRSKKA